MFKSQIMQKNKWDLFLRITLDKLSCSFCVIWFLYSLKKMKTLEIRSQESDSANMFYKLKNHYIF